MEYLEGDKNREEGMGGGTIDKIDIEFQAENPDEKVKRAQKPNGRCQSEVVAPKMILNRVLEKGAEQ